MEKIGIICEYNPFHNGHLYHINKIKEMYPDSLIILVMSTNFTQRGEISLLNKNNKTLIALNHNIDLVIELPFIFSTQSADIFAKGSIEILNKLKVDKLIFGSESNDIEKLIFLAKNQLNNKEYDYLVKEYLKEGINYPTALSKALKKLYNIEINSSNDLLALSYIKEIINQNTNIEPISIKRTNNYLSKELNSNIVSASAIREAIQNNKDIKAYVPIDTLKYINTKKIDYFNLLKYKIITLGKDINKYQTVDEGIENRILKYINDVNSLDELIEKVKTKRYTYNKLNRMFIHILCDFTKEQAQNNKDIKYIRVLGLNTNGQNYLNKIKKEIDIPIIVNKKNYLDLLEIELKSEKIYNLITNNKEKTQTQKKN